MRCSGSLNAERLVTHADLFDLYLLLHVSLQVVTETAGDWENYSTVRIFVIMVSL